MREKWTAIVIASIAVLGAGTVSYVKARVPYSVCRAVTNFDCQAGVTDEGHCEQLSGPEANCKGKSGTYCKDDSYKPPFMCMTDPATTKPCEPSESKPCGVKYYAVCQWDSGTCSVNVLATAPAGGAPCGIRTCDPANQ